jgi:hypothetical protein
VSVYEDDPLITDANQGYTNSTSTYHRQFQHGGLGLISKLLVEKSSAFFHSLQEDAPRRSTRNWTYRLNPSPPKGHMATESHLGRS